MFNKYDRFPIPPLPPMTPADRAFVEQVGRMLDDESGTGDPTDHEADRELEAQLDATNSCAAAADMV